MRQPVESVTKITSTDQERIHGLHDIVDVLTAPELYTWKRLKRQILCVYFLPSFFKANLKSRHTSSKIKSIYLSKNKKWIRGACKYLRDCIRGGAREEGG